MSQLVLTRSSHFKRPFVSRILSRFELGPYFLISSLLLFVVMMTVMTLVFSTRQVTKGYVLNSLDAEHQELVQELEVNEMQISQVRSLKYMENSPKVNSMVKPNQIVYLNGETAIASR